LACERHAALLETGPPEDLIDGINEMITNVSNEAAA
jgi:hypothetical protein